MVGFWAELQAYNAACVVCDATWVKAYATNNKHDIRAFTAACKARDAAWDAYHLAHEASYGVTRATGL